MPGVVNIDGTLCNVGKSISVAYFERCNDVRYDILISFERNRKIE